MKNLIFISISIIIFSIVSFGFEVSGSYFMELSGYERTFYGLKVTFADKSIIGLELGVFSPTDIIETGEITYLQPTTFILLQIPLKYLKIYGGISPIIQFYDNKFSLYSYTMYLTKAGIALYLGPLVISGGVNTVFDLSFQQTFGIYGVFANLGFRF
ncbi:hypothetical protein X275_10085 [Marinitoga sp. 1197]|uniref:hypothetical protein n=1 Tax=Marinitoga sp. 1197 TaxID=1428449 RepID=UPI000640E6C9|nr:hypothetical protein [Marinitoga sp. 1197]KLO21099.1 hypothetical protein X275_10085 [Marinitoga sp. 1197]